MARTKYSFTRFGQRLWIDSDGQQVAVLHLPQVCTSDSEFFVAKLIEAFKNENRFQEKQTSKAGVAL
jgi:hypothetical protein